MGRRRKKEKNNFVIYLLVVAVIVAGVIYGLVIKSKEKLQGNKADDLIPFEEVVSNELIEAGKVKDSNTIDDSNEDENIANVTNSAETNNLVNETTSKTTQEKATPGVTDKKQKAIELVKKTWGEDSSVSFAYEYIENGDYIISVKDKSSATVKNYFKVNLTTESVELYY